jgi:hypothetical protein
VNDINLATLKAEFDEYRRHRVDWETKTDSRLEQLMRQSDELNGIRKALIAVMSFLTFLGAIVGFIVHWFWPYGMQDRGH